MLTVGTQTLGVTFTPTDSVDYVGVTANVPIVVNQGSTTVTWANPATNHLRNQTDRPHTAQRDCLSSWFVRLQSNARNRADSRNPLSTLTLHHRLTVLITKGRRQQFLSLVDQATPTVTWAAPAAITYPTALSATQLDATPPVGIPGTLNYSPGLGTVLTAGTHQLAVTFNPTDAVDYQAW